VDSAKLQQGPQSAELHCTRLTSQRLRSTYRWRRDATRGALTTGKTLARAVLMEQYACTAALVALSTMRCGGWVALRRPPCFEVGLGATRLACANR
jgi:hypothetical protein